MIRDPLRGLPFEEAFESSDLFGPHAATGARRDVREKRTRDMPRVGQREDLVLDGLAVHGFLSLATLACAAGYQLTLKRHPGVTVPGPTLSAVFGGP